MGPARHRCGAAGPFAQGPCGAVLLFWRWVPFCSKLPCKPHYSYIEDADAVRQAVYDKASPPCRCGSGKQCTDSSLFTADLWTQKSWGEISKEDVCLHLSDFYCLTRPAELVLSLVSGVGHNHIYMYGVYTVFFGREITKCMVIYGVNIRFWPTLLIRDRLQPGEISATGNACGRVLLPTHPCTSTLLPEVFYSTILPGVPVPQKKKVKKIMQLV